MGAEKITFKEIKRRGMSRSEKIRNHFDVSLCEKASLRSPNRRLKVNKQGLFRFTLAISLAQSLNHEDVCQVQRRKLNL